MLVLPVLDTSIISAGTQYPFNIYPMPLDPAVLMYLVQQQPVLSTSAIIGAVYGGTLVKLVMTHPILDHHPFDDEYGIRVAFVHRELRKYLGDTYQGFKYLIANDEWSLLYPYSHMDHLASTEQCEYTAVLESFAQKKPTPHPTVKALPIRYGITLTAGDARESFKSIFKDRLYESDHPTVHLYLSHVGYTEPSYQFSLGSNELGIYISTRDKSQEALNEVLEAMKDPLIDLIHQIACANVGQY